MLLHQRYILKNPDEPHGLASSLSVLRTLDNAHFLGSDIPEIYTKDVKKQTRNTKLASVTLPTAAIPISRLLNHPNIISIIDIIQTSSLAGSVSEAGEHGDLTIWEDMNAGSLAYLLPNPDNLPHFQDAAKWEVLTAQNFQRFSLPESLCWHVLRSISRALLWLHEGLKETAGIPELFELHDTDWQPVLIMDVSPGQIWFQHPKGEETYGCCKLGGFQYAKVTGSPGARAASAKRIENMPVAKQWYWAPEVYQNVQSLSRASEIWSLGAVLYTMMTGHPPPRTSDYSWWISRLNDKGFTEGLRDTVAAMLKPYPGDRPTARMVVDRADDRYAGWRATTKEGREFVDVEDERLGERLKGISGGGLNL